MFLAKICWRETCAVLCRAIPQSTAKYTMSFKTTLIFIDAPAPEISLKEIGVKFH